LADLVDLAVLVVMPDDDARRRRLLAREGETFMAAWHALWDAAEDHYFANTAGTSRFNLVIEAD
jgi:para-aminobenzoate synthetase